MVLTPKIETMTDYPRDVVVLTQAYLAEAHAAAGGTLPVRTSNMRGQGSLPVFSHRGRCADAAGRRFVPVPHSCRRSFRGAGSGSLGTA